ncbi:MAG TPA: hypothetical protein VGY97_05550, partial [Solirubrobacteraceae bacterium]|nr:hypothetical protein [Solirubrobacteraceae bacterium]
AFEDARPAFAQLPAPGLAPDSDPVRATMAAFADTIVPGPAGGADPAPGAIEAGALDEVYDPYYSLTPAFPLIHSDLAVATPRVLGRPAQFTLALPYPDREKVILNRITGTGGNPNGNPNALMYAAPAVVIYIAYYGTARSNLGVQYIGFPPHSDGYWPGSSYRVSFRGMTADGNPP